MYVESYVVVSLSVNYIIKVLCIFTMMLLDVNICVAFLVQIKIDLYPKVSLPLM